VCSATNHGVEAENTTESVQSSHYPDDRSDRVPGRGEQQQQRAGPCVVESDRSQRRCPRGTAGIDGRPGARGTEGHQGDSGYASDHLALNVRFRTQQKRDDWTRQYEDRQSRDALDDRCDRQQSRFHRPKNAYRIVMISRSSNFRT